MLTVATKALWSQITEQGEIFYFIIIIFFLYYVLDIAPLGRLDCVSLTSWRREAVVQRSPKGKAL